MQRDLAALAESEFDLLIIGGGIYGATAAWDACLRGLSVALIDKGDFASGTSGNSLKIVHGGLRYLQHADVKRMRESISERKILLRIAPHLIHPLPCVMPTYGHFIKGPEVLGAAMLMNDMMSIDRNWGMDKLKKLPNGKVISKQKILHLVPFIDSKNLTGGAIWYDAQMHNSERLLLSFLHGAAENGAHMANYVQANAFLQKNGQIFGVQARDAVHGERFEIHARMTLNCAGPWINNLFDKLDSGRIPLQPYSTALNLVVKRSLGKEYAFGVNSKKTFKDEDVWISKGSRLLFVVPWRDYTLIGTDHKPFKGDAERYRVSEKEIETFLHEVNGAMPGANIQRDEVSYFYGGLLPMAGVNEKTGDVSLEKHFRLIDHEIAHSIKGLATVLSVKYTTARGVSEDAINLIMQKLNKSIFPSPSLIKPLWGGDIEDFEYFLKQISVERPDPVTDEQMLHLAVNYGTCLRHVLNLAKESKTWLEPVAGQTTVLRAEIIFAMRNEMAHKLVDVVRRRTELGSAECPSEPILQDCAKIMAQELQWDQNRIASEIEETRVIYKPK